MKTAQSGGNYNLLTNNCQHVADKVYKMGEPSFKNNRDVIESIVQHNNTWETIDYNPRDYFKDGPDLNSSSGRNECQIF